MEVNDSISLQKQVRDNSEDLQSEFLDLKNWEKLMKRKEQDLLSEANEQAQLPPIRNMNKKESATNTKESKSTEQNSKRIKSHDHAAWEKFNADKACDKLGKEEKSDDSSDDESLPESSSKDQAQQNHNKALEHKQDGNLFVQRKEWGKAIASYTKAIEIFPYDAIFYANRALCFLKQDNLYSAEVDCTSSIEINATYVKAYHRRATARMELKYYEGAKQDVEKVLAIEPSNKEAKALLNEINKRLKHSKTVITPKENRADDVPVEKKITEEKSDDVKSNEEIIDTKEDNNKEDNNKEDNSKEDNSKEDNSINIQSASTSVIRQMKSTTIPDWLPEKDNVNIVEPVKKPPHLRSKESFRKVLVQEADLTKPIKEEIETSCTKINNVELSDVSSVNTVKDNDESVIKTEPAVEENVTEIYTEIPPVPKSAVQFLISWKKCTSSDFRYKYMKQLPPGSLPKIFKDSMESSIFSDILTVLRTEFVKREESIFSYLKDLSDVRRFRALVMFISNSEKQDLKFMFLYCKMTEEISEEEIVEIQNKYEI